MKLIWALALVAKFLLAAPVAADPLQEGVAAYSRGDHRIALRLVRPLAQQGEAAETQGTFGTAHCRLGAAQAETWFGENVERRVMKVWSLLGGV